MKNFAIAAFVLLLPALGWSQNDFTTKWSNGYKVESADKNFKMKFGGRIQFDMAWFSQDDSITAAFGGKTSGVEFRRVRFFNEGQFYQNVHYKLQLEFSGGEVVFKDVFIELKDIPVVGNLRMGHFKEPFRLEVLSSSKDMSFMEREAYVAFMPERNFGAMIHNEALDKRIGWQLGVFRNADDAGNDKNAGEDYNLTARVSGLLLNDTKNHRMAQLGVAWSSRSPKNGEYSVASKPAAHLAPQYVSTGTINSVSAVNLVNAEAVMIAGPLYVQGEYLTASADANNSPSFSAWYGQVSYFLTGEHMSLEGSYSGLNRVKPRQNAGPGTGAWEVAVRYGTINLNDGNVAGGEMKEWTLGLNWYLNPATRIMANYVRADVADLGKSNIFETRVMVDF
jgi:phosphate-selective porin OprO and OprP